MVYKDPDYQKNYRAKNKEKKKEKAKEYYQKNKEQIIEKVATYTRLNKEKVAEYQKDYRDRNIDILLTYIDEYQEERRQNAYDSITTGEIIDQTKWDMWCNAIKSNAKKNKHPYSEDFTNDIMFDMMRKGCFYCGDVATTIDRVDSTLDHTPDNCVGCCKGCNNSKGAADISTFIRKAYYRARGVYADDDTDIWFTNKTKPKVCSYKYKAMKKEVPFELTKTDFEKLTKGDCAYCHRSPSSWFGIDRVIPMQGYVFGNVVSCCFDCNIDKLEDDIVTMSARNDRIATRVDTGELDIVDCDKVILHKGTHL